MTSLVAAASPLPPSAATSSRPFLTRRSEVSRVGHGGVWLKPADCRYPRPGRLRVGHLTSRSENRLPRSGFSVAARGNVPNEELRRSSSRELIFIVYFMHLLSFTMGGPLLPVLRRHFHLPAAKTGLLTSAFPFGMLFALSIFPQLSDRYGRKPILITCFLGLTVGFLLQGKALLSNWSFDSFLRLRAMSGAFAGCAVVIKAFIADAYATTSLPQAMAFREAAGTASYIVGPTLGGHLISLGGIASIAFSGAALSLLAVLLLLFIPPPPQVKRPKAGEGRRREMFLRASPVQLLFVVILVHGLYGLGQSVFDAFFGVWCSESFGFSPARVGEVLTALACLVFIAHTFLYSRLVSRYGLVQVAVMGLLSIACAFIAMSFHMLPLVLLFYAFGVPAFTPSIPTLLAKLAPPHLRGRIIAWDAQVLSVARILSPTLLGFLYDDGPLRAFAFSASALIVAAGLMASQANAVARRSNGTT